MATRQTSQLQNLNPWVKPASSQPEPEPEPSPREEPPTPSQSAPGANPFRHEQTSFQQATSSLDHESDLLQRRIEEIQARELETEQYLKSQENFIQQAKAALDQEIDELQRRIDEVQARESEIDRAILNQAGLEQKELQYQQREAQMLAREAELNNRILALEASLQQNGKSLEQEKQALATQEAALLSRQAEWEKAKEDQDKNLLEAQNSLQAKEAQLRSREEELAKQERESSSRTSQQPLSSATATEPLNDLQRREEALQLREVASEKAFNERQSALNEAQKGLDRQQEELEDKKKQLKEQEDRAKKASLGEVNLIQEELEKHPLSAPTPPSSPSANQAEGFEDWGSSQATQPPPKEHARQQETPHIQSQDADSFATQPTDPKSRKKRLITLTLVALLGTLALALLFGPIQKWYGSGNPSASQPEQAAPPSETTPPSQGGKQAQAILLQPIEEEMNAEELLAIQESLAKQASAVNTAESRQATQEEQQKAEALKQAQAEQARAFQAILSTVDGDIQSNRLSRPAGNNALEKLQSILDIDPEFEAAKQGMIRVAEKYVILAEGAVLKKQWARAELLLSKARSIHPPLASINRVQTLLENAR
ncbi:MAG: hypothetical protein HQL72_06650 [Magnetococcales bacterium]|nr:hypothetical protein [Magnetococcales bacterium]